MISHGLGINGNAENAQIVSTLLMHKLDKWVGWMQKIEFQPRLQYAES
jgi:hypothetical protein